MNFYLNINSLKKDVNQVCKKNKNCLKIINKKKLQNEVIDKLIYTVVFTKNALIKKQASQIIRKLALALDIYPASIHNLYMSFGQKKQIPFTTPAMNLRTLTYDIAQTIFEIALEKKMTAFIFEIARSEIGYTNQSPVEYASCILAAAIKQGYSGPVFIQGDHYQFKPKLFEQNKNKEINNIKKLIDQSIKAGFYNIDIDASTLVDLTKKDLDQQQKNNYQMTGLLTKYIRKIQPKGVTVSIGGEIGHIGGKNSTIGDFKAFMKGYLKIIKKDKLTPISKISVQTGTSHGGVPMANGQIAKVKIDFKVLKDIAKIAQEEYQIGGPVQHGASTLPEELFDYFPKNNTLEIHLATGLQNIVYDCLPKILVKKMYDYLKKNHHQEWEKDWNETQFIYKLRKKALAPFKKELWNLPHKTKKIIKEKLRKKLLILFKKLNCFNNKKYLNDLY